jgi:[ribosomal protein S5]-alanine N-acetyltransferase
MPLRGTSDLPDDDMPAEIDFRGGERGRYFRRLDPSGLRLETPRLLLREMTPADAPALHAVIGDPENMLWYPHPFSMEEVDAWIARQMERYATGTGLLGLVLRETGAFLGDCGPVWQTADEGQPPELEIGYHVHRAWQGRGLATEAARAVRDYAFTTLGVDHVISLIRPENLPSRRVAEKNGLTLHRTVVWRGYESCVYRLNRP